jgi:hypothetical protein
MLNGARGVEGAVGKRKPLGNLAMPLISGKRSRTAATSKTTTPG